MNRLDHERAIARIELRRRWRVLNGNAAQLIAIAFTGLFFVPFSMLGFVGLYFAGAEIGSGSIDAPLEVVRVGFVALWLAAAGFGGYRAYAKALRPDRPDAYLTTVSHRTLLNGLLIAEFALWGTVTVLAGGAGALAFAAGAGSHVVAPLAFVTACLTVTTGMAIGAFGAAIVMNAGVRSKLARRVRTVLLVVGGIAYFWLLTTQNIAGVFEPLVRGLEPTPVGWFGDLVLLGTVPEASVARGLGAIVASGIFLVASGRFLPRLAAWLWYADGITVEHDTSAATPVKSDEPRLSTLLSRPVVGVTLADWKRARRAPITLSYAIYPLVFLINPIVTTLREGTIGPSLPLSLALSGVWITGVLFSLNVLGNEGAALPATLLSAAPGRSLIVGHVVAGALVTVPVTVVATAGLGLASPRPAPWVATLTLGTTVLACCAGPIASGIGAAFPRFDAVSVSRSREAVVPSTLAFALYSVAMIVVALPLLLGHSSLVAHAFASWFGLSTASVGLVGTLLTTVIAVPFGALSANYAIRSVEGYDMS